MLAQMPVLQVRTRYLAASSSPFSQAAPSSDRSPPLWSVCALTCCSLEWAMLTWLEAFPLVTGGVGTAAPHPVEGERF